MDVKQQRPSLVVRRRDLPKYVGLKRTQLDALIASGQFPEGVLVRDGGRARIWLESEILARQATRLAAVGKLRHPR
jgi:predicted DNA-binding transcriptional regulator AlpA